MLIPKSTPIGYFYNILNIEEIYEDGAAQLVKLSKSEHAVFRYWSEGYSPEVIAERVRINKKSVLNSKARLLNKYGVHDKNSLLLIASILFKRKIIKLGESSENTP